MVQFIPSMPLAEILSLHDNSILAYLKLHNPNPEGPYGLDPVAMDTYVKSCGR